MKLLCLFKHKWQREIIIKNYSIVEDIYLYDSCIRCKNAFRRKTFTYYGTLVQSWTKVSKEHFISQWTIHKLGKFGE